MAMMHRLLKEMMQQCRDRRSIANSADGFNKNERGARDASA